jgi:hypothetical protein
MTPMTIDQPIARPLPKHKRAQTQNKRLHTPNIHALSEIRNHDPSARASENSSCLRPRGYCDQLSASLVHHNYQQRRKHCQPTCNSRIIFQTNT